MKLTRTLTKSTWAVLGGNAPERGVEFLVEGVKVAEQEFEKEKRRICIYRTLARYSGHGPIHDPDGGFFIGEKENIVQYVPTRWYRSQ